MKKTKIAPAKLQHLFSEYPSFNKSGSIFGMRKLYYGANALLVKCGQYIYNVSSNPELFNSL
jgi:hypothetical protein